MKYEITKGSKKDFEGAPDWTIFLLKGRYAAKAWASSYSNGAKALTPGTKDEYTIDAIEDCTIIAERRPITEPVVNQKLTTEWDGKGLPPVGTACEIKRAIDWIPVTIKFISYYHTIFKTPEGQELCYQTCALQFRPIRSPEDVARDEAKGIIAELCRSSASNGHSADLIYDAIAAGRIKGLIKEPSTTDLKISITTDEMWREFEKKSDMEDVYKLFRERASRRGSF